MSDVLNDEWPVIEPPEQLVRKTVARKKVRRATQAKKMVAGIPVPAAPKPEPGRDLSEPDVCTDCGLEIANKSSHRTWHAQQDKKFHILQKELQQLNMIVAQAIKGQAGEMPTIIMDAQQENENYARKYIDQDYYFKRCKTAEYHRTKMADEKVRKVGDDYHYDKT